MNTVSVKGLTISTCHGVNDFEKVQPQRFVFYADVTTDFYAAAHSDDVTKTINYSTLCKRITAVAQGNVFNLIETLAYRCAEDIMQNFPSAQAVTLTVEKPDAPVKADFDTVSVSVTLKRQTVLLSLGSSVGDKKAYLDFAAEALAKIDGVKVVALSSYYENAPYGGVAKGSFLNACVKIETWLQPEVLLNEIHSIENEGGRVRSKRWDDRTLDIDIIFYGNEVICKEGLCIPHPDYLNRDFVIIPLKEIAPDFVCPLTHRRVADLPTPNRAGN